MGEHLDEMKTYFEENTSIEYGYEISAVSLAAKVNQRQIENSRDSSLLIYSSCSIAILLLSLSLYQCKSKKNEKQDCDEFEKYV